MFRIPIALLGVGAVRLADTERPTAGGTLNMPRARRLLAESFVVF
jgi:hypothetical protein